MMQRCYLSDGNIKCKICGKEVSTVYMNGPIGATCDACMFETNPPSMVIIDATSSGELYNVRAGKYEFSMTIADLEECGWHISEISQKRSDDNKTIRTSYVLEYHGEKKCRRFPKYNYWASNAPMCNLNACAQMCKLDERIHAAVNQNDFMT